MADHADGLAAGIKRVEGVEGGIEGFAIQRAEPLVKEQRVDTCFMTHQIRERQCQRQADKEALSTGKRARIAYRVCLPGIDHLQLQRLAGFTLQQVAAVQAGELVIRQPDQVIQRQPLGKLTELIPLFRANQPIQVAPVCEQAGRLFNLLQQRLLALTTLGVLPQLLADLALTGGVLPQLLCQCV